MSFILYVILGFLAEMIDGTAGMAYGVSSNTFLRTAGVPSAISSACVHVAMGCIILYKGIRGGSTNHRPFGRYIYPLAFSGGFSDALGGGGWGPVVTSTLIASDHEPRRTIGTVNTAEFFVTVAETTAFVLLLKNVSNYYMIVLGLIVGGVIAAPIAARLCVRIPARAMLLFIGTLVIILNIYKVITLL